MIMPMGRPSVGCNFRLHDCFSNMKADTACVTCVLRRIARTFWAQFSQYTRRRPAH